MPVRKLSSMGSRGDSTTYGISLEQSDLDRDGLLDLLENGEDVHACVDRKEPGRYEIVIPAIQDDRVEPPAD